MSSDLQDTSFLGGEPPLTPAPGVVLRGRYRLDEEIARGAMGVVFRAADLELGREVAVKILLAAGSAPETRAKLLHEARAAATLNHPHIVAVHDVGEDRSVPFFVMELVRGPNLRAAQPTGLERVIEIGVQICQALEHAHVRGIVHRDLKPENVLLSDATPSGRVKLADLGLATPTRGSELTQTGTLAGTVAYMAPEQALGIPLDGRADLYSLGVVLYELVTGRRPFLGDDPIAVVSQHVHAPAVPPRALRPDLPRSVDAVIQRLLAKDREQRFESAGATGAALRTALTDRDAGVAEDSLASVAILDALSRGRLVGRSEELAEVRELWRRAREKRGHGVLLSGEPGAGKTRLAREIIVEATLGGAVVLTGACYEYEAATPYLPFVEAFRGWVRGSTDRERLRETLGEAAPQIAKLVPEINSRLELEPHRAEVAPHEERLLLFEGVAEVCRRLARPRGLLFYIDDLHWADGSSLVLLGHLLRRLATEPVLFVASYRETELDRAHPLAKALVEWNRERLTTRIALRRFRLEETRAQLSALLGEEVSEAFTGAVHAETEGNPFFVEEVLKALIDQGSVRREAGRWERNEIQDLEIPQSMKAAIGARLDRVSPACNEALRTAAVVGKVFAFRELAAASPDATEDALLDAIDEAVGAQLVMVQNEDSFAFTHDKIREVLYEEMNPIRRRRLHRRLAEALTALRGKVRVPAERVAHHWIEAGAHEEGLALAREAALEAERVSAFDEAIAAYTRAIECAEALGRTTDRIDLHEAIGHAETLRGSLLPAREHFERALSLASDPPSRARLLSLVAGPLVTIGDERGLEYVRQALEVLDPVTQAVDVANALMIEGRFHHLRGRHRRAIELFERALSLLPSVESSSTLTSRELGTLSLLRAYTAGAYQHLGLFADSDRTAMGSIEIGRKIDNQLFEASGHEFMGENAINTGEWRAGVEHGLAEREIVRKAHSREREAWSYVPTACCRVLLGEYEAAESDFLAGIALADLVGEKRLASLLRTWAAWSNVLGGRTDLALERVPEAMERAEQSGLLYLRTEARRVLALLRFRLGDVDAAISLCDEVLALTEATESRVSRLWTGPLHVEALLSAGRRTEAEERLREYAAMVAECQAPHFTREVARLEALVSDSIDPTRRATSAPSERTHGEGES